MKALLYFIINFVKMFNANFMLIFLLKVSRLGPLLKWDFIIFYSRGMGNNRRAHVQHFLTLTLKFAEIYVFKLTLTLSSDGRSFNVRRERNFLQSCCKVLLNQAVVSAADP